MDDGIFDAIDPELVQPVPRQARRRVWSLLGCAVAGAMLACALSGVAAFEWMVAALGVGVFASVVRSEVARICVLLGVVLLSAAWFELRTGSMGQGSVQNIVGAEQRVLVEVRGLVTSGPQPSPPRLDHLARFRRTEPLVHFDLDLTHLVASGRAREARGRLRVTVKAEEDQALPGPGDRIRVKGWYTPVRRAMNPGQADARRWSNMTGSVGSLFVSSERLVEVEGPARFDLRAWQVRTLADVREHLLSLIERGDEHARGRAVLSALLLGQTSPELRDARTVFAQSGTAHLLAISGFHLAILCLLGVMLFRLAGEHGTLEAAMVAGLVVVLLLLVPARVPIVRAGVLVLALLVSETLGRHYDRITLLGWIALGLYVWRPMDVFSLGAQLSVGITGLLLWLSSSRHPWVAPAPIRGLVRRRRPAGVRFMGWVRSYLVVCVLCWAFSFPIVAAHTGVVSFVGPIATAVVTPAVVALLGAGYIGLALGSVVPDVGHWVFDQLAGFAEQAVQMVEGMAGVSVLVFDLTPPSWLWAGAMIVTLGRFVARARLRAWRELAAIGVLVAWIWVGPSLRPSLASGVMLRIDTLAVGDGTCHIIRSGDEAMIWDCGSLRMDLRPTLEKAADALGVAHAGCGVITHANLDHYVSMPDAVEVFGISRMFVSPHVIEQTGAPERALLDFLDEQGVRVVPVRRGDEIALGEAQLRFIWPDEHTDELASNDRSLVCMVSVATAAGERRLLLTGDIQGAAMQRLLEDPASLRADVLEIPHHGSFRSESMSFLAAVDPAVVIQSTGSGRAGDARWADHRAGRTWLTTAVDGAAWVEFHHDGRIEAGSMRSASR